MLTKRRAPKIKYLSPAQVAELYGIGERTVRRMCADGRLPAIELPMGRSGRTFKIREQDAEALGRPVQPDEVAE